MRSLWVICIWCWATLNEVVKVFHEIGSDALYSVNVPPSTGLHGPVHPGTVAATADGVAVAAAVVGAAVAALVAAAVATVVALAVGAAVGGVLVGVAAAPPQ